MVRVYHEHPGRGGMTFRSFGPLARLDPHVRDARQRPRESPEGRGVLYLAADLRTALAEAYPDQWPQVMICPHACAAWLAPTRPLELLDLTADGALAIGAVGTLAWGDEPRRRTQRSARRIYERYADLDGVRYRAAHQGGESLALWDRVHGLAGGAGLDRSLWSAWSRLVAALAAQRRAPRRIPATDCATCQTAGYRR